jgi:hypothetical protein
VGSLQVVYNSCYNRLKVRALVWVKLSLYYGCKRCLIGDIDPLISHIVAYGLVKDVFRQADVYKRPLEIRKAETE